jgi:hypothetical protein
MAWLLHSRMLSWHAWRHAACGAQRAPKRTAASCGSACGVAERCSGARSDRVRAYQPRSGADTCSGCTSASDAPSERPHSMAPMTAIDQAHRCAQDVRPNRMPARLSAQFASIGAACWPQRLSGRTAAAPGQSPAAGTLLGVRRAPPQRSTARRTCPCGRCPRVRPLCARVQARWGERREGQKSPISSLTGAPPKQRAAACRCRLRGDRKSRTRRCRMSSVERRGGAEARGQAAWRLQSASTAPRCAATRQRRDGTGCLADARGNRRRGPRSRRARGHREKGPNGGGAWL